MAKNHRKGPENTTLQPLTPKTGKPKIGDKYTFIPEAFIGEASGFLPGRQAIPRRVTGTVTYINEAHRWFLVEYWVHGFHLSESFKY